MRGKCSWKARKYPEMYREMVCLEGMIKPVGKMSSYVRILAEIRSYASAEMFHGNGGSVSVTGSTLPNESNSLWGSLSSREERESGSKGGNREGSEMKDGVSSVLLGTESCPISSM